MRIFIRPNPLKAEARRCAVNVAKALLRFAEERGESLELLFEPEARGIFEESGKLKCFDATDAVKVCDIVIPVGGDGTVMRSAREAARHGKPVLGVNAGRVGFLTQLEDHELAELKKLFTGGYALYDRMMLDAVLENPGAKGEYVAINDVVISHGDSGRVVDIEVRRAEMLLARHRGDGVIFSTPTGSTAYSMSAGGPVVSPELSLILMTAICPVSRLGNSLVLSPESVYTVREPAAECDGQKRSNGGKDHREYRNDTKDNGGLFLALDGTRAGRLEQGGAVHIGRSRTVARVIDLGLREFFENFNQKLTWGG